ncbi:hypothetical protein NXS08_00800 [Gleimia sp. 6138-11-ORH1]|uniref:DUF6541 family protein n=1 Tax=Gleimia sp. 6138-11-ORH1 TaxID=2973937 RepID=UPI0021689A37|nr:DUF6541 family protein [Gleimia sp. 6138-11-ORH1]MCS4484030.1 hypothetical protein [Gleimia sp. 6138-11-ORH1]
MVGIWFILGVSLASLLVIYLPSLLMLRSLGAKGYLLFGLAPAWSAGVSTAASLIFAKFEISWNLTNFMLFNLLSLFLCLLIGRIIFGARFEKTQEGTEDIPVPQGKLGLIATLILLLLGTIFYWLPTIWGIDLNYPAQQNDSTFHLSAVMTILQTGDASPLTAFSSLYGLSDVNVTYPAVWHQLAALFATEQTVVQVAKALQFTVAFLWLANISILTTVALPRLWGAGLLGIAVAQIIPVFPVYYHVNIPLWPNAWGIALLPGVVSALLTAFRNYKYYPRGQYRVKRDLTMQISVVFLGILGITAAYPPAAFSLMVILSGGMLVGISRVLLSSLKIRTKIAVLFIGGIFGGLFSYYVSYNESINWLFNRRPEIDWNNLGFKAWAVFSLFPAGGGTITYKIIVTLAGLLSVLGVVLSWRNLYTRWVSISWIISLILVVGTLVPLPLITNLTAIWYYGSYRLMPVMAILSIITMTIGVNALLRKTLKIIQKFSSGKIDSKVYKTAIVSVAISLVIANGVISWGIRSAKAVELYKPTLGQTVFMADSEELKMIFRAKEVLTEDKLLLGEASTGATLIYIVSGHPVVYKQVTFGSVDNADPDAGYLAANFKHYKTDPHICELVTKYNIGYFYADRSQTFNHKQQKDRASGLFGVVLDPQDFILLDDGGTAELYKFVGCELKKP